MLPRCPLRQEPDFCTRQLTYFMSTPIPSFGCTFKVGELVCTLVAEAGEAVVPLPTLELDEIGIMADANAVQKRGSFSSESV